MIPWLYEALTGRPYFTGRSAAAEFGPPPAVRYADDLAPLTDYEVLQYGHLVVARAKARQELVEVAR